VVRAQAQALLADSLKTMFVTADIRELGQILDYPAVREFIGSGQPVGLLLAIAGRDLLRLRRRRGQGALTQPRGMIGSVM
jgi:hypothetical protein